MLRSRSEGEFREFGGRLQESRRPHPCRRVFRWSKNNRKAVLYAAGVTAVLVGLYFVPSGYLAVYPGPVKPMQEMVSVEGHPASSGRLYMVLVMVKETNLYEALYAAISPRAALWRKEAILGGLSLEEYSEKARQEMEESQRLAVELALEMSGYPVTPGEESPLKVTLDTGDIGGPSAGLMFFLEISSRLKPDELKPTGKVAGTGILRPDGSVAAVGGIEQKTMAARAAGIQYFIVPWQNELSARKYAGTMKILPVRDCSEALQALREVSGE
ncbi:MAG TPA: hypothetical protein GX510_02580 [Firmicutes bacterium]|nr:hypothetical protein [Candidatus Fermentithermobacillaceae bacterium]